MSPVQSLVHAAKIMGVALTEGQTSQLGQLLDELERWNRTYNLTAIKDREQMVTHHLLDSLAVHGDLHGTTIADVGTGAGFPGLPLAVLNPDRRFTLIDSAGKKIRFVCHVAHALGLTNVEGIHARVESLHPERPFDTIVTRAFAALPEMLEKVAPLSGADTRILAMKGRWPREEIASLPREWRVASSRELTIPGLGEARCVIAITR